MRGAMVCLPAGVVALSGCFATQSDVRVLQSDVGLVRAEAVAADSAHRVQLDRVLGAVNALNASLEATGTSVRDLTAVVRRVSDSVAALDSRMGRFRSDMSTSMASVEQELLQVQELTGQSQRRLQELRSSIETRQQAQQPPPQSPQPGVPPAADGGTPGDATPGPNQLYQAALEQMRQKSYATARMAFQDLLAKYPDSDLAADAQFYVAETYAAEGDAGAADSLYAMVSTKYATSPRAATAMYKRATLAQKAGHGGQALQLFKDVIKKYPRSDEASLARDRVKALAK